MEKIEQAINILKECIDIATKNGGFSKAQEAAMAVMALNTIVQEFSLLKTNKEDNSTSVKKVSK